MKITSRTFAELGSIRAARRMEAHMAGATFAVYCVKKNGDTYARPDAVFATVEAAAAKSAYWTQINPGRTYRVVAQ